MESEKAEYIEAESETVMTKVGRRGNKMSVEGHKIAVMQVG